MIRTTHAGSLPRPPALADLHGRRSRGEPVDADELRRTVEDAYGYVRVRGFEPFQQEQMVLAYVDAHGQISRAQAADLCAIAPAQASRLLGRLVRRGELVLRGERRGTVYTRP